MASNTIERTWRVHGVEELERLAAAVAVNLAAGDRIALEGELGAGKTAFVRGLVRGLGHPDPREVVSPTFAIHNRYEGGRLAVDHLDLYRIPPPVSLAREGLDTVVSDRTGVLCCEWAERLRDSIGSQTIEISIAFLTEDSRAVTVRAPLGESERLFRGLPIA